MRVISQDGKMDVQYEMFVFAVSKDNCIVDCTETASSPEKIYQGIMAKYSTEEKAMKAIEMLRESYVGKPFVVVKNHKLSEDEIKKIANGNITCDFDYSRVTASSNNIVFQFPKDNDL